MTASQQPARTVPWYDRRTFRHIREAVEAYIFLLPGTLLLVVFNLVPIGYAFYISLHNWRIRKGDFIGLENFVQALGAPLDILYVIGGLICLGASWMVWRKIQADTPAHELILRFGFGVLLIVGGMGLFLGLPDMLKHGDKDLFNSLMLTLWYSIGTVPIQIALSFILAFVLFQNIKGKTIWRIIYFLPYVTVTVASAAVWQSIFDPSKGQINQFLMSLGLAEKDLPRWLFSPTGVNTYLGGLFGWEVPAWLGGPSLALVAVMIYNIWTFVGYNAVIYLAGLGNIPRALYEAADIDGANRWQVLRRLTIPLVSPTTYFLVMMGVLGTFRAFNHIYVMTGVAGPVGAPNGTTMVASMLIWKHFWEGHRFGYASALAFVLTGVMLSLTWIQNRASEGRVFYG